jgi:hypothetical protein
MNRTRVTLVNRKGQSVLVEYVEAGTVHRRYVPVDEVQGGAVENEVLEQGIQYGFPWEEVELTFNAEQFAKEMHNVSIWTVEDALRNPKNLWSALRATLAENLTEILTIASGEKKRGRHGNNK